MKRRFSLIIIFCLLINGSGLLNSIELKTFDITFLNTKSMIFSGWWGVFCSINQASKNLNNYIKDNCPLWPQLKPNKNQTKTEKSAHSDFIASNSLKRTNEFKRDKICNIYNKQIYNNLYCLPSNNTLIHQNSPPDINRFIYLFLLAYLIVLFESNLPWEIITSYKNRIKNPAYKFKSGFLFVFKISLNEILPP